jgi:uncharacterized protein
VNPAPGLEDHKEVIMPTRTEAPLGAPCMIDLTSSDVERAQDFYGKVFGWTFESAGPEYGGYINAAKDGHPVAGLLANNPEWQAPDNWTTYFHTSDIYTTVSALTAAGGTSHVAPMEIAARGLTSLAADPSGAFFGLWQPLEHRGFEVFGEAGAPVWHQLTTRDYRAAVNFYRTVFGWRTEKVADTDEFRYTTALFGDQQLLGVMDGVGYIPEDALANWTIFFGAEDVDKTLQVISDKGGTVLQPADDTPFGRLAAAADPTGTPFHLSSLES